MKLNNLFISIDRHLESQKRPRFSDGGELGFQRQKQPDEYPDPDRGGGQYASTLNVQHRVKTFDHGP